MQIWMQIYMLQAYIWMIWILEIHFQKKRDCVSKRFSTEDEYFLMEIKYRKYLGTPFTNLTHLLCIQIQAIFTHVFIARHFPPSLHKKLFYRISFSFFIRSGKIYLLLMKNSLLYRNLVHFRVWFSVLFVQ